MSILRVIKKLRQILSRHQKVRIIELGILMIIAGFLEMLSVSLILPFMEAIIDPENVMANKYVVMVCELCGIQSYRTFLVLLALVMAFLYIFKNVFLLFQMMIQNRFIAYNQLYTKRQMLRAYLMRPYEYFLDVKSGDVLQVINGDTSIVYGLLGSLLSFFAESVVSFFLIITILIMSPGITLGVAALMLVMIGIIQTVMRPINSRMGAEMRTVGAGLQQWLIQAVQGIKELKITGSESFFERKFNTYGNKYVQIEYKHMTLILVPRFMIEAVSMASFFIVIAFMIYRGQPLETLLPILSGVAMAAIRLLPSVNRITGALAGIAYSEAALDNMGKRLNEMTSIRSSNLMEESIGAEKLGIISGLKDVVQLKGVEYKYPQGHENVLDGADMVIRRGQSVGIVGSSGAGKTTAVDILLGLLAPGKGTVTVDGEDIHSDMGGWLAQIGYIPQSIFILDGTIRDNVAFGKETDKENDEQVWRALHEAALEEYVRSLPDGLDTQLGERGVRLSGGQRQRIGIARALYNDPQILFFDEATSALDNETEAAIMESINSLQGEKTMIIIAHRLTTIENCNVVYRVTDGKIVKER